ncbi:MAG: hypothetical protein LC104_02145 [Bacteroidales bacterium]|nr:hypothetical protein [Bacteroidales bacterium]
MSGRGTILVLAPTGDVRGAAVPKALAQHGGLFGLPWFVAVRESATPEEIAQAVAVVSFGPVGELGDRVEYWGDEPIPPLAERLFQRLRASMVEPETESQAKSERKSATQSRTLALTAKVGRETAGRRGKGVVTIFDLPITESQLKELAATLKSRCGTGGTVKEGRIEIQGDIRDRVIAELEKLGYKVKRVGG